MGAFSSEKQRRLWGGPEQTCADLGRFDLPALTEKDLAPVMGLRNVNSVRFYSLTPDAANYTTGAAGVFYPRQTAVVDVVELVPRVRTWLEATTQSMGNWASREELSDALLKTGIGPVAVSRDEIPLAQLNQVLKDNHTLTLIGFDILQVPRCRITFRAE
jgi:hypothetical protein